MVGERDLARHGRRTAAAQRHRAGGVMRRAEDARGPALRCKLPDQTQHRGRLERFVRRHRRQDAGEALRQHRLAGARRADQQDAVTAGGRNLDRATRDELALDVEQIRVNWRSQPDHRVMFGDRARRRITGLGAQMLDDLQQCAGRERWECHRRVPPRRRSRPAQRSRGAVRPCVPTRHRIRHCQRAAHWPQFSGQRQFAGEFVLVERARRNLSRWRPGCRVRSADRSVRTPSADRPARD